MYKKRLKMAIEQSCQGSRTQSENFVPLTFLDSLEYQLGSLYLQGQSMPRRRATKS